MNKPVLAASVAALALLAGCSMHADGVGNAPVVSVTDQPWRIENAPKGFNTIATKCSADVPGARIWLAENGKQPVITNDESCKAGA